MSKIKLADGWFRMGRPEIGFYREDTGEGYRVVYNPFGRGVVIIYRGNWDGEGNEYLPQVFRTIKDGGKYLKGLMIEKGILKVN